MRRSAPNDRGAAEECNDVEHSIKEKRTPENGDFGTIKTIRGFLKMRFIRFFYALIVH